MSAQQLESSQGRRPRRVAAQQGDARRKENPDSSSDDDADSDGSFVAKSKAKAKAQKGPRQSSSSSMSVDSTSTIRKRASNAKIPRPESTATPMRKKQFDSVSVSLPSYKPLKRPHSPGSSTSSELSSAPDSESHTASTSPKKKRTKATPAKQRPKTPALSRARSNSRSSANTRPSSSRAPGPSNLSASVSAKPPSTLGYGAFGAPTPSSSQQSSSTFRPLSQSSTRLQPGSSFSTMFDEPPVEDVWDVDEVIRPYSAVFVRLSGPPYDPGCCIDEEGPLWWPAEITSKKTQVTLHEGKEGVQLKELIAPSERTVVSLINPTNDSKRYDAASFYVGDSSQCTDKLVRKWRDALHVISEDDNINVVGDDDAVSSSSSSEENAPTAEMENKRRIAKILHEDGQQLIGKIVMGHRGENYLCHWPGRVTSVEFKGKHETKVHFAIEFWDEKRPRYLHRDLFYTEDDDRFFTCEMGPAREVTLKEEYASRSPSPEPQLPLPDEISFTDLPLRHQLAYVRNVLLAVIRDEYPPAQDSVDAWYRRGKSSSDHFGEFDQDAILAEIVPMLLREKWDPELEMHQDYNLGASSSAHLSVSSLHSPDLDSEPPSSATVADSTGASEAGTPDTSVEDPANLQLPASGQSGSLGQSERPRGSERFEHLTQIERRLFCADILTSQAAIQLALWRKGVRTTIEVLEPEQETHLHSEGVVLLDQRSDADIPLDELYGVVAKRRAERRPFTMPVASGSSSDAMIDAEVSGTSRLRRRAKMK